LAFWSLSLISWQNVCWLTTQLSPTFTATPEALGSSGVLSF